MEASQNRDAMRELCAEKPKSDLPNCDIHFTGHLLIVSRDKEEGTAWRVILRAISSDSELPKK